MQNPATILIAARNAAPTIRRAVASAVSQGNYPILLIDDFSTDDTVAQARQAAGAQLRVIRPPVHETLGATRHSGLMAVRTTYGVWLDADDELMPGRVERLVQAMELENADIVADEAELIDGLTGRYIRSLPIPAFLLGHHPLARLFERNYLPGPGVIGFRTAFAQSIGYDPGLHGPEDTDFLLRSIRAGGRFHLLPVPGYRLHAYPQSVSRDLDNQRRMYCSLLRKHSYEEVHRLYLQAGHSDRIAAWGLVSFSLYREDYSRALEFVELAAARIEDPEEVLEPGGASNAPEGWRAAFHRGTTLLLLGRNEEAISLLEGAESIRPTPEGANNLGVALRRLGRSDFAREMFRRSLARFPEFRDPAINVTDECATRITSHPLRSWSARSDYGQAGGQAQESMSVHPAR